MKRTLLLLSLIFILVYTNINIPVYATENIDIIAEVQVEEVQDETEEPVIEEPQNEITEPIIEEIIEEQSEFEIEEETSSEKQIDIYGIYVLKQGVSENLDLSGSTSSSYWTKVQYQDEIKATLGEGDIPVFKSPTGETNARVEVNKDSFIISLNNAVGLDTVDDYEWNYQKIIHENDGWHLDCIAYIPMYDIVFITNDDNIILNNQTIMKNSKISQPEISKEGYTLVGWSLDSEGKNLYDFNSLVKSKFVLYAQWNKNKEEIKEEEPSKEETEINEEEKPSEEEPKIEEKEEEIIIPIPKPNPNPFIPNSEPTEEEQYCGEPSATEEKPLVIPVLQSDPIVFNEDPLAAVGGIRIIEDNQDFLSLRRPIVPGSSFNPLTKGVIAEDGDTPLGGIHLEHNCIIHLIEILILIIYSIYIIIVLFTKKKEDEDEENN